MEKERELLKKASVRPTVEPLCAMHKIVQQQEKTMDTVLCKHCKFMKFATNSSPVQNTVVSTSQLPDAPVKPLLLDTLPVTSFKTIKEYDEDQKKRCTRSKKAKKAKKKSVHLPADQLPHGRTLGNVHVFPEVSTNPASKTGEPLFLEENLKVFSNSPSIINPAHPRARCYEFFSTLTRADHAFYFFFSFMIYMHYPQG